MTLDELKAALARHKVALSVSTTGGLKYDAPQPIPVTLLEGMKAHKAKLLAEVTQKGAKSSESLPPLTTSSGPKVATFAINPPIKLDTAPPAAGTCAACAHWVALEGWGYNMGKCDAPLRYFAPGNGPGLAISGAHTCPSTGGAAWQAKAAAPTKLDTQQAQAVGL